MRNVWMVAGLILAGFSTSSLSQETTEGGESAAAPAKRAACKESGMKNGLHGQALTDHIQVCFEEAKLVCLKDAVAQKVTGKDRNEFIKKCLGLPG